jgi:hypothetical protein
VSVMVTWQGEVVGICRTRFNGEVSVVTQFMTSLEARRQCKGISNLMLARQIELLAERGVRYLVYGKFGVLPSLDRFKVNNGFTPTPVNYNYLLLTPKARALGLLGLHRRPDILFSKYARSILPVLSTLQGCLPPRLIMQLHLYA